MLRLLPELSVRRPVTIVMAFLALCVLGAIAWNQIPLELMPGRFTPSSLWVSVSYPGGTPRENEAAILLPLEEQLSTLSGVKDMSGQAGEGSVSFSIEFHRSVNMDEAYNDVVDRMERTMVDLPDDVQNYNVFRWNPADTPIVWAGVSIGEDIEYPYQFAEEFIKARIERVDGVGQVEIWGANPRQVYVDFSLDALSEHGVSLYEVIQVLQGDNFQLASGRMTDRGQVRYVRSLARYADLDELAQTPIKPGIVVEDVAELLYGTVSSSAINRIDGQEGIGMAISKESDANTVATAERVQAVLTELEQSPQAKGTHFFTFFDQGELIEDSISNLLTSAMYGGIFAVLVLFAFLRDLRMTMLIASCIPFALLLTVMWMFFNGGSLNLLSLLGLMIAVGMVVDNSIVVVEAIYARRAAGEAPKRAAINGSGEVSLAITLSTLTTMVVFLPVILLTEDADFSFFMGELGFPVVWALAASLIVALVFTPLTTTLLRSDGARAFKEPRWVLFLSRHYARGLRWVLTRRSDALLGIAAMAFVTFVIPMQAVSCQEGDGRNITEFEIVYSFPAEHTYDDRVALVDMFEGYVEEHREEWGVKVHRSRVGGSSGYGRTTVHLEDDRPAEMMSKEAVVSEAQDGLPELPGVEAQIGWSSSQDSESPTFKVILRGDDTETLAVLGEDVRRMIRTVPGVIGARPDLEERGSDEMRLNVDRNASARYGIGASQVGQTVASALRGTRLPDYHDGDIEVSVSAQFRAEDRDNMGRLLEFPMFSPAVMGSIPLRALVDTEVGSGLGTIQRSNRQTAWPITIDVDPKADISLVRATVNAGLGQMDFPRGYTWQQPSFGDQSDDEARNLALALSVIMVFLIMGVLFESFLLPLSIITTIPMAMFGVYWTLYLTRTPLDVMGGVGLIILIGVVVNNGIVLIDLVTKLRETMSRTEALIEAGRRRMRPILMTALTTIFGLMPMAVGSTEFIGIPYAPMGRVVAGGMVAGTLLTLFFVPYLYSILDDMRDSGVRWAGWVSRRPQGTTVKEGIAK
jgi:HAE1 family hydrophobic/amphiphilic exporter-1